MLFFRFCPHWPGHGLQLPRDSNTSVYPATSYSSSAPAVSLCRPRFDYIRRRGILVRMHREKARRAHAARLFRKTEITPVVLSPQKSRHLEKDPPSPRIDRTRCERVANAAFNFINFIKRGTIIDTPDRKRKLSPIDDSNDATPLRNVAPGILSLSLSLSLSLWLSLRVKAREFASRELRWFPRDRRQNVLSAVTIALIL